MTRNLLLLCAPSCALLCMSLPSFARQPSRAMPAPQANAAKDAADRAVLKRNEECNAAELRGDVAAMDDCETADFTHTHASGQVEEKAGYLKGVGSGAHKFLLLDLSGVHVRSYGDSAVVEGHMHLRADNLGKIADVQNIFMTVWVKQRGKWRESAWIAVGAPKSNPAVSENR